MTGTAISSKVEVGKGNLAKTRNTLRDLQYSRDLASFFLVLHYFITCVHGVALHSTLCEYDGLRHRKGLKQSSRSILINTGHEENFVTKSSNAL